MERARGDHYVYYFSINNLCVLCVMSFGIIFLPSWLEFHAFFGYYFQYTGVKTMLLAELGAPIEDLLKKVNETWGRL